MLVPDAGPTWLSQMENRFRRRHRNGDISIDDAARVLRELVGILWDTQTKPAARYQVDDELTNVAHDLDEVAYMLEEMIEKRDSEKQSKTMLDLADEDYRKRLNCVPT